MEDNKKAFIEFAIHCGMLCFGEFVLKSGRISPYFFDSGMFNSGEKLARLASFYAIAVEDSSIAYDMLFGAAYKGIPLVAAVAVSLSNDFGRDVPYCFSGQVVGANLASRVLIVDDVVSAGTSVNESVGLIRAAGAIPAGAAVSVDRQERGQDCRSAIRAIEADLGPSVLSLVSLDDLVAYLETDPGRREILDRVRAYRQTYGARA